MAYKNIICPYALGTSIFFGILIFGWIAHIKGRRISCFCAAAFGVVGYGLLLGCVLDNG